MNAEQERQTYLREQEAAAWQRRWYRRRLRVLTRWVLDDGDSLDGAGFILIARALRVMREDAR